MSEYTPPPPPPPYAPPAAPPPAPEKKKGLPPLAWVGIGCGALLVVALIVFVAGSMFVAKKVRDVAGDFEDNPAMALATTMVRLHPELELVESDQEAGTLTVRNKETGEVLTVNLEDVEEGRISFESEGETVTMGMEEGDDGEGAFTVRDSEGKATFRVGAGGEGEIPAWVPRYEDLEVQGTFQSRTESEITGGFSFETTDSVEEVMDFYAGAFAGEGLSESGRNTYQSGDTRGGMLTGEGDGRTVSLMISAEAGKTTVVVTYNEKREG
jgi:hypothetical protein